jgi:hypothetical protein
MITKRNMKLDLFDLDSALLSVNPLAASLWRRLASPWILPLLMLTLPVAAVEAQYSYTTNNGVVTITQYTGPGGTVTIPAVIAGLPVTSIGTLAFAYSTTVTNVTIPNSVTNIGVAAFTDCTRLTSVTIGTKVSRIGDQAFFDCAGLTGVTIPNGVTNVGNQAFYNCISLSSVTIPNSVTTIAAESFSWCGLTSVSISSSLTNIGAFAFDSCRGLSAITVDALNPSYISLAGVLFSKDQTTLIQCPGAKAGAYAVPNGVTSIGSSAFRNCNNLTSIAIPNSVTNIGDTVFSACASLSLITVDPLNARYSSLAGALFDKAQTTLIQCPAALVGIYALPNSVTNIETTAFLGCEQLSTITAQTANSYYSSLAGVLFNKSLTTLVQCPGAITGAFVIPNGVTQLGDYSIAYSLNLSKVTIPNSVTNIGLATFAGCASLTNLSIPGSVRTIGSEAFETCYGLTSLVISNGVTSIGTYAFYQCSGLTNVTIPNSVKSISDRAFQACNGLSTVTLGNGVTNIGALTFGFCPALTGVYCRGNAPSVDPSAFANDNATVYYLAGATGWSATSGGLPTALWNPLVQTGNSSFGVRTNRFGFTVTGPVNLGIVVEACTNLSSPVWSPIQTNVLTGGSAFFNDPQWTNYRARFYRILAP